MLLAPLVIFIIILIALGTYQAISLQSNSIDDIYNNRFKGYQNSSYILVEMSTVQAKLYKIMNWIASNFDKQRIEELAKQTDAQITTTVEFTKKILDSIMTAGREKILSNGVRESRGISEQAKSTLEMARPRTPAQRSWPSAWPKISSSFSTKACGTSTSLKTSSATKVRICSESRQYGPGNLSRRSAHCGHYLPIDKHFCNQTDSETNQGNDRRASTFG